MFSASLSSASLVSVEVLALLEAEAEADADAEVVEGFTGASSSVIMMLAKLDAGLGWTTGG